MAISLSKGQNVSLSKTDPSLKNVLIGLGWDTRATDGQDFDLDASVFMTAESGKVPSDSHFIFYNQLQSPCGGVEHTGDNLTGNGDGDDETIIVKLDQVSSNIKSLFVTVTIHDAENRRQNFGQVSNAFDDDFPHRGSLPSQIMIYCNLVLTLIVNRSGMHLIIQ